jgi:acetyl-CoA carboxylase/biotin carboxylase 1
MMEMYCYEDARGGVLEPQGIVEIKYRKSKLLSTMERLDPKYTELKRQLDDPTKTKEELLSIASHIKKYEETCLGVYEQAAVELADLHDRPQRMLKKGVIREIVDWKSSREYFYWRLNRRVKELEVSRTLQISRQETLNTLGDWIRSDLGNVHIGDEEFVKWFSKNKGSNAARMSAFKKQKMLMSLQKMYKEDPELFQQFLESQ